MPKVVDHDKRREEIAAIAVEVIRRMGVENVTLRDIAGAGGFTGGVLAHYFRNKDELIRYSLEWLVDCWLTEARRDVGAAGDPREKLRRAVHDLVPKTTASLAGGVFLNLWATACTDPEIRKISARFYREWRGILRRHLKEAIEAGAIRRRVDVKGMIDTLIAAVDGMLVAMTLQPERFRPKRVRFLLDRLVDGLIG